MTPKYIEVPVCSSVPRYVCTPTIKQVPDTICVDETYTKCAKVPNQVRKEKGQIGNCQKKNQILFFRLFLIHPSRFAVMFLTRCAKM